MGSFDTRLFLDFNGFAGRTAWLHGFARAYAGAAGVVVLAVLLLVAWWRARGGAFGSGAPDRVADVVWTAAGALVAAVVALPIAHAVGRQRPYAAIHQAVNVLIARGGGFGMPSARAALAGAVLAGLLLAQDWLVAVAAAVAGLLLAAAQVYVGAWYPGDVAGGLLLGAAVVVIARPAVIVVLRAGARWVAGVKGLRFVVGASAPVTLGAAVARAGSAGPAEAGATAVGAGAVVAGGAGASGSVRILEHGATIVPHVPEGVAPPAARSLTPAQTHVRPAPATANAGARDAGEAGRRGAAGSAGDL